MVFEDRSTELLKYLLRAHVPNGWKLADLKQD